MATPYYNAGNGAPVVVQGTIVSAPNTNEGKNESLMQANVYQHQQPPQYQQQQQQQYGNMNVAPNNGAGAGWNKEERHPGAHNNGQCRDGFWAILFYMHLALMFFCAVTFFPQMAADMAENEGNDAGRRLMRMTPLRFMEENWDNEEDNWEQQGDDANNGGWNGDYEEADYNNDANGEQVDLDISMEALVFILGATALAAFTVSSLAMSFMMVFAAGLIKTALIFNIVMFGVLALVSLTSGVMEVALMCLVGCGFSAWYAYSVWGRVPFAAANLVTALTAVRANIGLTFYAYLNLGASFVWSIIWAIATIGTMYVVNGCDSSGECENEDGSSTIVIFLFVVSYYWVAEVLKNIVHCTVAGTVGTWWFVPHEANGCCSKGVRESYWRSITTSFGSICFGSLIVAIIQAVKEIVHSMREQEGGGSVLLCCLEFIVGCIANIVEYFNKWAFVYVGLYGYSFIDAGKNVMQLFSQRGWTAIIADVLVDTVLFMVSVGVGVLTGVVGLLAAGLVGAGTESVGVLMLIGFIFGLFLGFMISTILFGLVSSAVNTVIVCYAEAPSEFEAKYPELSGKMREAWRQAYPNEFSY